MTLKSGTLLIRRTAYLLTQTIRRFKAALLCLGLTAFGGLSAQAAPVVTINGSPAPAPVTVQVGQSVIFTVQASDADPGATVTLSSAALPAGARTTLPLPFTSPPPVTYLFFWTPTASQLGSHVLTFFATDNLGVQSAVSLSVFVDSPPVANCKAATLVAGADCHALLLPFLINNGSFDPDGDPITLTVSGDSNPTPAPFLTLSGTGDHTVTLTVTDNHGGVNTCIATVIVLDQTPPVITVLGPNPAIVECHSSFTDAGATAHDNCAGDLIPASTGSVDVNTPGTYGIVYTVSDPSGNSASALRLVNVVDTTPPIITVLGANPATVECHSSYTDAGATATDTCAGALTPTTSGTVDVTTPGTYTITYSVSDPSGNAATATRTVNVLDTTPPVITVLGANPATVECHSSYTDAGATATDTCAGALTPTTSGTVDVTTPGTYTITYSVSDPSGNAATATRTVNVLDTTPPVITVLGDNPVTVECHSSYTDAGATAADICASALTPTTSGTVDVNTPGTYTITYSVSDPAGNVATATRTVNVVDTAPPVITVVGNNPATVECHSSYTDAGATAADTCAGALTPTTSGTVDVTTPGTYTITYSVSDPSGNAATATRTVKVVDTTPPVITVLGNNPATVECHSSYNDAGATAADLCASALTPKATGTVDVTTPGTYTITYSVSDPAGNLATATRTVNVVDTAPPVITVVGANPAMVECHTSYTDSGATAVDACAGSLLPTTTGTVDVNTPGTYTITYSVSDPSGNAATATRTVKVVDTTPPVITITATPANGVLGCNPTAAAIEAALGTATASDACGTPTLTLATGSILNTGGCGRSQTRTWQATDPSGNPATASRTVTWTEDTTPPVISCPPDITVTCAGSTDPSVTGTATATDDCGSVSISYSDSGALGCQAPFGTITRTWTAVDGCGNASSCIQTLSSSAATSSITSSFNGTSISTANWIWFSANFSAKGIPANGATIFLKNSSIAITSAKGNFAYPVPDGRIVFSPSVTCATTVFVGAQWVTTVPLSGSNEILLSALGIKAPADLRAATVTWSGAFSADSAGIGLNWKWGAAVYTTDMTQARYNNLGVKPTHAAACLYNNSDHAGTPETVKASVVGGARGGGGANYTGGWTGTTSVSPSP
jgi:hypothetical protein